MKWLKHFWPYLTLVTILLVGVGFFVAFWNDGNRLASLGSLFGFVLAALLVWITILYVHTNQQTLELMREQWSFQNEVRVKFGLRERGNVPQLWIVNYGQRDIVLTKVVIEMPDHKPRTEFKNVVVRAGEKKRYSLPHRGWGRLEMQQHVQVRVFCESAMQQFEDAKAYTLYLTERNEVYKVRVGLLSVEHVEKEATADNVEN
jgi:hypothetical protein